eukprot:403357469
MDILVPEGLVKLDLQLERDVDNQVPPLEEVQHQPIIDDYYEEDLQDMMFLGMMDNICSICAQMLPEIAQNEGEKGMIIGNEMTYCPIQKSNHRGHRKCVEDAAFKEIQTKIQTYCCDCQMPLADEKIIDEFTYYISNKNAIVKTINVVTGIKSFSQKIRDLIIQEYNDELIKVNKVLICKKCNHHTSLKRGEVNYKQLDRHGKSMSEDAAINCNLNKIECEQCRMSHCFKCKHEPYHLGFTCEDFQEWKKLRKCRFCQAIFGDKQQELKKDLAFDLVCNQMECIKLMEKSCAKVHPDCNHFCGGTSTETTCLPCLDPFCVVRYDDSRTFGVHSEEYCMICYTDLLGQAPVLQLNCKHLFHQHCIDTLLTKDHKGSRIAFGHLDCPSCGIEMENSSCNVIQNKITGEKSLKEQVHYSALNTAQREKLFEEEEFKNRPEFQDKQKEYAMLKLAMYRCFQCQTIYCGGRRDCEAEMNEANRPPPEDILCIYCNAYKHGDKLKPCETHGTEYIDYKCQFCCTPATFFCFGATRYCDPCHNNACQVFGKPCLGKEGGCAFNGDHLPNGTPYHAGCKMCKVLEEEKSKEVLNLAEQDKKPIEQAVEDIKPVIQKEEIIQPQIEVIHQEEFKQEEIPSIDEIEPLVPQPLRGRRASINIADQIIIDDQAVSEIQDSKSIEEEEFL